MILLCKVCGKHNETKRGKGDTFFSFKLSYLLMIMDNTICSAPKSSDERRPVNHVELVRHLRQQVQGLKASARGI